MRAWISIPLMLALGGCMAAVDHDPVVLPTGRWWQAMNDPELSFLMARAVPQPSAKANLDDAQISLAAADLAHTYIDLRAQQTALVLLARREDLDEQQAAIARLDGAAAAVRCGSHAQAQLAATHRAQARVRAKIAALRDNLAGLTASSSGALDDMIGGPIPLPPAQRVASDTVGMIERVPANTKPAARGRPIGDTLPQNARQALHRYDAARQTAAIAQSRAERAQADAAVQAAGARAGIIAPAEAIDADRQALGVLQAEEHARAAMTQAYVELAKALTLRHSVQRKQASRF